MADTKISSLPNASALGGTEQLAAVQSGGNVNVTPTQITTYASQHLGDAVGDTLTFGPALSTFSAAIQNDWQQTPNFIGYKNTPFYSTFVLASESDGTSFEYNAGLVGVASITGTPPDNGGYIVGATGTAYYSGTGAAFSDVGGPNFIGVEANLNNESTGTVTYAAGVHVTSAKNLGGGAFDTIYGLYLEPQTVGTHNYQIYSAGASPASFGGPVVTRAVHVANLPSASASGMGARHFVDDALTTVILGLGTTVTGGGSNKVPVYSDGTNWKYG